MDINLIAAFLGGALALLSPCGALLLPAFFAATSGSRGRLLINGVVFYAGLAVTLVPLGLGAGVLGSLLTANREVIIVVAGWIIIALGVMQIFGLGFDLARLVPGARKVQGEAGRRPPLLRAVLLGLVSGVAGFCAGPILGAVLTMAATEDSLLRAGMLLAGYGVGMVLPLLLIAAVWQQLGQRGRTMLRGKQFRLGPLTLHSTSVITGLLLITVGVVFIRTSGMASLPDLLPAQALAAVQEWISTVSSAVPDVLVIIAAALLALLTWALLARRSARRREAAENDEIAEVTNDETGGASTNEAHAPEARETTSPTTTLASRET